jgi:hypothetical protein
VLFKVGRQLLLFWLALSVVLVRRRLRDRRSGSGKRRDGGRRDPERTLSSERDDVRARCHARARREGSRASRRLHATLAAPTCVAGEGEIFCAWTAKPSGAPRHPWSHRGRPSVTQGEPGRRVRLRNFAGLCQPWKGKTHDDGGHPDVGPRLKRPVRGPRGLASSPDMVSLTASRYRPSPNRHGSSARPGERVLHAASGSLQSRPGNGSRHERTVLMW